MTLRGSAGHQVLHVDLVLLREDVNPEDLEALSKEAGELGAVEGVQAVGAIEAEGPSDFDIAFFFIIDSPADLEAFGTDSRYVRFLQGGLARALRSFGGADVHLGGPYTGAAAFVACVALAASPQTYDWQVREALDNWCASSEQAVSGLAVGERQRYRGIGIMFSDEPISRPALGFEGFGIDFISGRGRMLS